jgi:hypothetical protein
MTKMAKQRMLPRGITRILTTMSKQCTKPPMCNDCCGARAPGKPWRGKGKRYIQRHLKKTPHPGEVVSVDQLESSIPALTTVPLTDHKDSVDHNQKDFDYRHVIGKLLYLEKSTRPDISCAVHQCARHCANPKIQHTAAVKRIGIVPIQRFNTQQQLKG